MNFNQVKCNDNEYECRLSKKCILKSDRCNTNFDCDLKEDEQDCGNLVYFTFCTVFLHTSLL